VLAMIFIVKPFEKNWGFIWFKRQYRKPVMAIFFSFLILSSYATEELDSLCAVGAFMMGSIMLMFLNQDDIYRKVEDVAVILLLPFIFVYGLQTEIGLINDSLFMESNRSNYCSSRYGRFLGRLAAADLWENWKIV
jgi:Kef-type K+ transport system membrane component KefB